MAVLNRKEEKLQVVLGRLPKKYTDEEFVSMFIKLYSKDWGKIKSTYIKQSQDKEPGTVINMPKPELYLKQILHSFLQKQAEPVVAPAVKAPAPEIASPKAKKVATKKASPVTETTVAKAKTTKKKVVEVEEAVAEVKKTKKVATKKTDTETKPKAVKKEKIAKI